MEERLPRLKIDDLSFYNCKILYMSFLLRMISDAEKVCKTHFYDGSEEVNERERMNAVKYFRSADCQNICEIFGVNYEAFRAYAEGKLKADPQGLKYKNKITGVKEKRRSTKNKKVV